MLTADEIIQQKEWHSLSNDEREILSGLADSETEFNLLKKMLMVSADAVDEVPDLNPAIQQQLRNNLPGQRKSSHKMYWYAAAAAVLAMMLTAVFLFNKPQKHSYVKQPDIIKRVERIPLPIKDVAVEDSTASFVKKSPAAVIQPARSTAPKPSSTLLLDSIAAADTYAAVDVSVSADPALLQFITEVE
ncbi:MAG: hypothetical protein EOO13_03065 [Chitinophagaceae bacterium]|nr:MAG: hypothetical protein EOO13_03065 [Chitinophagaceae bacterium]